MSIIINKLQHFGKTMVRQNQRSIVGFAEGLNCSIILLDKWILLEFLLQFFFMIFCKITKPIRSDTLVYHDWFNKSILNKN